MPMLIDNILNRGRCENILRITYQRKEVHRQYDNIIHLTVRFDFKLGLPMSKKKNDEISMWSP